METQESATYWLWFKLNSYHLVPERKEWVLMGIIPAPLTTRGRTPFLPFAPWSQGHCSSTLTPPPKTSQLFSVPQEGTISCSSPEVQQRLEALPAALVAPLQYILSRVNVAKLLWQWRHQLIL